MLKIGNGKRDDTVFTFSSIRKQMLKHCAWNNKRVIEKFDEQVA